MRQAPAGRPARGRDAEAEHRRHYFAHSTVGPFGLCSVLARKVGLSPRRSRAETAAALAQTMLEQARARPRRGPRHARRVARGRAPALHRRLRPQEPFVLVLACHPSLENRLAEPTYHALDQRITTVTRLAPLSLDETAEYVRLRLEAAGAKSQPHFDDDAIGALFDVATGNPAPHQPRRHERDRVATSAMIVAAARKRHAIGTQDVHDARVDRGGA